jgi:hypothetical protein
MGLIATHLLKRSFRMGLLVARKWGYHTCLHLHMFFVWQKQNHAGHQPRKHTIQYTILPNFLRTSSRRVDMFGTGWVCSFPATVCIFVRSWNFISKPLTKPHNPHTQQTTISPSHASFPWYSSTCCAHVYQHSPLPPDPYPCNPEEDSYPWKYPSDYWCDPAQLKQSYHQHITKEPDYTQTLTRTSVNKLFTLWVDPFGTSEP